MTKNRFLCKNFLNFLSHQCLFMFFEVFFKTLNRYFIEPWLSFNCKKMLLTVILHLKIFFFFGILIDFFLNTKVFSCLFEALFVFFDGFLHKKSVFIKFSLNFLYNCSNLSYFSITEFTQICEFSIFYLKVFDKLKLLLIFVIVLVGKLTETHQKFVFNFCFSDFLWFFNNFSNELKFFLMQSFLFNQVKC